MFSNLKHSEMAATLATIDPISQGAGTVTTGWVSAADFLAYRAEVRTGVMGASGTLDAKLEQATSSGGAGAKDVTGKAIVQIVKATGDGKQAYINVRPEELDANNGYGWFRLSMTVGTAASLIAGKVEGIHPRYAPASAKNQAGVVQVVG